MDDSTLLLTNITRFGTILFIIYTVGVLLNVYRYLMRLAAYHEARADALILMHNYSTEDAERYQKFVDSLNAEKIDFGKEQKAPIAQVLEIAKAFKK